MHRVGVDGTTATLEQLQLRNVQSFQLHSAPFPYNRIEHLSKTKVINRSLVWGWEKPYRYKWKSHSQVMWKCTWYKCTGCNITRLALYNISPVIKTHMKTSQFEHDHIGHVTRLLSINAASFNIFQNFTIHPCSKLVHSEWISIIQVEDFESQGTRTSFENSPQQLLRPVTFETRF